MANPKIKLEPGSFYHIYNRGNNSCDLFREKTNYEHFLRLCDKHISPVAEIIAWVLMRNHFHFLVYIRSSLNQPNPQGFKNPEGLVDLTDKPISQQFSNLFNAYTKAINKKYHRTGSLFEHPFRRKIIEDERYLELVIDYIHNNPVHHGFCNHPSEYPWSSYLNQMPPGFIRNSQLLGQGLE